MQQLNAISQQVVLHWLTRLAVQVQQLPDTTSATMTDHLASLIQARLQPLQCKSQMQPAVCCFWAPLCIAWCNHALEAGLYVIWHSHCGAASCRLIIAAPAVPQDLAPSTYILTLTF